VATTDLVEAPID